MGPCPLAPRSLVVNAVAVEWEFLAWNSRSGYVLRTTSPVRRVIDGRPEELAVGLKPVGPEIPADAESRWNGVAVEGALFFGSAAKVIEIGRASCRERV